MAEREREELVTRFFAYSDGLEGYKDRVSAFLFTYSQKMNIYLRDNPKDIESYRQRFLDTMQFVQNNFPLGFSRTQKGTVTPRSRFEAIAIGSYLALQKQPNLVEPLISVETWLDKQKFKDVTGADGANAIGRLRTRINFVRDHLLGDVE